MRNEKLTKIETICNRLIDRADLVDPADLVEDAERILELLAELDKQDWECTLAAANESAYRVALAHVKAAAAAIATADRNKTVR
jgi:hypothetical protein